MDDSIGRLEGKVLEAIALIQNLRQENTQLRERCQTQESSADDLRATVARLQRELGDAQQTADQVTQFEEKRRIIEEKVGGLLEKLEAMG